MLLKKKIKKEVENTETEKKTDGKKFKFEWNDLRCLITLINVVLIMRFGLSIAWFGLAVACIGCLKDATEIPSGRFRWSSLIIHLSNIVLNIFFLLQIK